MHTFWNAQFSFLAWKVLGKLQETLGLSMINQSHNKTAAV